jgi:hypothetical protein
MCNFEEYTQRNSSELTQDILPPLESANLSPPGQTVYQQVGERGESHKWVELQGKWSRALPLLRRQVYIEQLEATLLAIYRPEEKGTSV